MKKAKITLPKNFLLGAASAAHQIEGDLDNDWTRWENETNENRSLSALADYNRQSNFLGEFPNKHWEIVKDQASEPSNYISGKATNYREYFRKDIELLGKMGLNSYRFSIEWSRVQPEEGIYSLEAIRFYESVLEYLDELKITPMVTLWHFTSPNWFVDKGGWEKKENIKYFEEFVSAIVSRFKGRVKYWVILNEPVGYTFSSRLGGVFPPNKRNIFSFYNAYKNFKFAHKKAYEVIKNIDRESKVGIAKNNIYFYSNNDNIFSRQIIKLSNIIYNHNFLDEIQDHFDFLGLNFYNSIDVNPSKLIKMIFGRNSSSHLDREISDLGWVLDQDAFSKVIDDILKYNKPIIITEHGIADQFDKKREKYVYEALRVIQEKIDRGDRIEGYYYWSLTDNFEWDKGFWPKFGLVEVDYTNYERRVRKSSRVFKNIKLSK